MWGNTKQNVKYTEWETVELIHLVHGKDYWRDFLDKVTNLRVS